MIGIIGGTGIYEIVEMGEEMETLIIETPYGKSPEISIFKLHDKEVAFMPRHAKGHVNPPHMINYRANVYAMKQMNVERIIATNAVGSLEIDVKPGDFLVPNDFLDFTKIREFTFYDSKTVHIDITEPYCHDLRDVLISSGDMVENGVYICTEGPRFETAAEIKMFKQLGGSVVGMTGIPEAILARELEICYASICMVTNYAASISTSRLTVEEVFEVVKGQKDRLVKLLSDSIAKLPEERECPCKYALLGAEIDKV